MNNIVKMNRSYNLIKVETLTEKSIMEREGEVFFLFVAAILCGCIIWMLNGNNFHLFRSSEGDGNNDGEEEEEEGAVGYYYFH